MAIDSTNKVGDINEQTGLIRLKDVEDFLIQCDEFMSVRDNELETMAQVVSDNLLDSAPDGESNESLKCQLKFMREIGFLFRNLIRPI